MSLQRPDRNPVAASPLTFFGALHSRAATLWVLASAGACLTLLVYFPGQLNGDSQTQYSEALTGAYTDWHPPIMAALWRLLIPIIDGPAAMLVVQVLLHWFAFAVIADALHRTGRKTLAFIVLASAASPLFFFYLARIHKDFQLASALLAAFALLFHFKARAKPVPLPILLVSLLLWSYAVLVRANGIFAGAPLLLYALPAASRLSRPAMAVVASAVILAVLPLSFVFNRTVLGAQPTGVTQTLQMFDIAGTAYNSGDAAKFNAVTDGYTPKLEGCYTPLFWDALSKDRCNRLWFKLPAPGTPQRSEIGKAWLSSIVDHPLAYAAHRLKHFNMSLNFMTVPAQQCFAAPEMHDCGALKDGRMSEASKQPIYLVDYVKKNVLYWPIVWLVVAGGLVAVLHRRSTPIAEAAFLLAVSGIVYSLAYLVVGVAADPRYHYWSIMAIQTGALIAMADFSWPRWKSPVIATAVILGATIVLGYAFRITETDVFLR